MICSTKIIKIRTRVWKKLVKTRNLYGFQSLSETIDYLLGNDKVNKLLKEEIENVYNNTETKSLY